jgi:hypothetical protein
MSGVSFPVKNVELRKGVQFFKNFVISWHDGKKDGRYGGNFG